MMSYYANKVLGRRVNSNTDNMKNRATPQKAISAETLMASKAPVYTGAACWGKFPPSPRCGRTLSRPPV